jgi:hypothetical protein
MHPKMDNANIEQLKRTKWIIADFTFLFRVEVICISQERFRIWVLRVLSPTSDKRLVFLRLMLGNDS